MNNIGEGVTEKGILSGLRLAISSKALRILGLRQNETQWIRRINYQFLYLTKPLVYWSNCH